MRLFNISSIEGISSRFGIEAGQMLRALLQVTRQAYLAALRLVQSLFGYSMGNSWQSAAGNTFAIATTGPAMPMGTLGVIAGQYLNTPAVNDSKDVTKPCPGTTYVEHRLRGIRNGLCQRFV